MLSIFFIDGASLLDITDYSWIVYFFYGFDSHTDSYWYFLFFFSFLFFYCFLPHNIHLPLPKPNIINNTKYNCNINIITA